MWLLQSLYQNAPVSGMGGGGGEVDTLVTLALARMIRLPPFFNLLQP